jgi:hypothetical protein
MTAPANALVSGRGLRLVEPGGRLRTGFRIGVVEMEPGADSGGAQRERSKP